MAKNDGEKQIEGSQPAPDFARETGMPKGDRQLSQEQYNPSPMDPSKGGGKGKAGD
jgi:hypothetical protein